MFSILYFAAASALTAAERFPAYTRKLLDGQVNDACATAAAWSDSYGADRDGDAAPMLAYGDVQLVLGRLIDAEETYRRVLRLIRHSREALRIVSCRNAGWQAFFQSRFTTALSCFKRIGEEPEASAAQRMESLLGEVLALHHLGGLALSGTRLDALAALAKQSADERWSVLALVLRRELAVLQEIRSADELRDHIYWRSVETDFVTGDAVGVDMPLACAVAGLPILEGRLRHLEHLRRYASGARSEVDALGDHLQWARRAGLADYHRGLCLEVAVASIAAGVPTCAETMLAQCRVPDAQQPWHERWYLEYAYCLAKVRQRQGRVMESSQLYGRYALAAIRHVRSDQVSVPAGGTGGDPARQPKSDDVSVRLPGKYRRAYRYLMDNLDQRDLSVRELAAHIGVTERAIQAAFKTHLGLSPSQLIRRQRMERIHEELASEDGRLASVIEVANRWGVQHRSTLVSGYRRLYREAPSQTLGR